MAEDVRGVRARITTPYLDQARTECLGRAWALLPRRGWEEIGSWPLCFALQLLTLRRCLGIYLRIPT